MLAASTVLADAFMQAHGVPHGNYGGLYIFLLFSSIGGIWFS